MTHINSGLTWIIYFNEVLFPLMVSVIYFIDTVIFAIFYLYESNKLKNKIEWVDTSLAGVFFCVICYPPFNEIASKFIPWEHSEYINFVSPEVTFILRCVVLALLTIYVTATINLGAKASNLTYRGVTSTGIYGIVRHPAYVSKVFMWWIVSIPLFLDYPIFIFNALAWTFIYYMRAITEEKNLSQSPDYIQYCKSVKYKFIPHLI
ncbi:MAG: hypothetical protein NW207_05650 [Cytophagales bacterium]|nr:hypothetical protein [Cytophagales bacterium]